MLAKNWLQPSQGAELAAHINAINADESRMQPIRAAAAERVQAVIRGPDSTEDGEAP